MTSGKWFAGQGRMVFCAGNFVVKPWPVAKHERYFLEVGDLQGWQPGSDRAGSLCSLQMFKNFSA